MSVLASVKEEISSANVGYISRRSLMDKHKSSFAVNRALSKAIQDGDIVRVWRGLYWKGVKTQFGLTHPHAFDTGLEILREHGYTSGVGPAGWTASHMLGLSNQIPANTHIAVPGRAPNCPAGLKFHSRTTGNRLGLEITEVALLEAVRTFPYQAEVGWDILVIKFHELISQGSVNAERLLVAADGERHISVRNNMQNLYSTLR